MPAPHSRFRTRSLLMPVLGGLIAVLNGCDPDGDGLRNERAWGTDRLNPDTDGDRVLDGEEVERGLDPLNADTDGDGYLNGDELLEGSDPLDAESRIYITGPASRPHDSRNSRSTAAASNFEVTRWNVDSTLFRRQF